MRLFHGSCRNSPFVTPNGSTFTNYALVTFSGALQGSIAECRCLTAEAVRYVHMNPLCTGADTTPEEYSWSGHRANLVMKCLPWLTVDGLPLHFSTNVDVIRKSDRVLLPMVRARDGEQSSIAGVFAQGALNEVLALQNRTGLFLIR
jgi:hypothetical protein